MLYKGGYIIYRCMMNNSLLYIRSTVAGLATMQHQCMGDNVNFLKNVFLGVKMEF